MRNEWITFPIGAFVWFPTKRVLVSSWPMLMKYQKFMHEKIIIKGKTRDVHFIMNDDSVFGGHGFIYDVHEYEPKDLLDIKMWYFMEDRFVVYPNNVDIKSHE